MELTQVTNEETKDLLDRWTKARRAAIEKIKELFFLPLHHGKESDCEESELEDILVRAKAINSDAAIEQLYKTVFDHSRKLALSFSKFKNIHFEIEDFKNLFQESDLICLKGNWERKSDAFVLKRTGCNACANGSSGACQFWREACDGLVMGLGDKERFVRYACKRNVDTGDAECIDILFNDVSPAKKSLAWGEIPEHMNSGIQKARADFKEKMKVGVQVMGINDGILFYQFESSPDRLCGGGKILEDAFARKIQKTFPGLRLKEISPLAVMGTEK